MEQGDSWARELTRRVGQGVRQKRESSGMSAQQVSDRTADVGMRVSRARIAALESGERGGEVKVAELIVLARALMIPPLALLYPGVPGTRVVAFPAAEGETTSIDAAMWFAGERPHGVLLPLPGGGEDYTYWGDDWSDFEDGAALLRLGRRESEKLATLSRKKGERHKAEERGASDAEMALLATDISAIEKDIREIRETVRRLGGEPGHLGPAHSYLDGREA